MESEILTDTLGAVGSFISVVTYAPQVIKIFKSKSTKDISMPMLLLLSFGVAIWLAYGFLLHNAALIVTNILILAMSLVMIFLKLKYDKRITQ